MDEKLKMFVWTAVILIFLVFVVNPLQASIDEAIKGSAQLQAQRLASTINMASTAQDQTTYNFEMPNAKCNATITDRFVRVQIKPELGDSLEYTVSLIKTSVIITKGTFDCKKNRNLRLTKIGNLLRIS